MPRAVAQNALFVKGATNDMFENLSAGVKHNIYTPYKVAKSILLIYPVSEGRNNWHLLFPIAGIKLAKC